jgi:aminoglycoside phosphotransferase
MSEPIPTAEHAAKAAEIHLGWRPVEVRRFATGSAHYVFDLTGANGQKAVARFGLAAYEPALREGAALLARVAALGVPVPALYAVDRLDGLPFMLMERLGGTDLGHVIATLDDPQLQAIAGHVAAAQAAVAGYGSAGRYGYSATPETALHAKWTGVLEAHMERSRQRMLKAGLFDPVIIAPVEAWLDRLRPALDRIPATPFLHDTTTKNVLIADGRFTGIVDVDDLCFGDPRYAPALTLAVLMMMGWPEQYAGYWMAAAGHAADEAFRLYVALFLLDLMAEHGQVFNGNERPSTAEGRAHLSAMLARALA